MPSMGNARASESARARQLSGSQEKQGFGGSFTAFIVRATGQLEF